MGKKIFWIGLAALLISFFILSEVFHMRGAIISVFIWVTLMAILIGIGIEIGMLTAKTQKRPFEVRGRKKKIAGLILFLIGIIALIAAVSLVIDAGCTERYNEIWYALISAVIGVLFLLTGLLYFTSGKRDVEL